MGTPSPAVIDAFVAAINARDLEALHAVFTDDLVLEWPQSGERIVGNDSRKEVYARMPTLPRIAPWRVTGSGDLWVLEAGLDYGDGHAYLGTFVFELRDALIARGVSYWSEPFPPPEWRAPWVERFQPGS